jgi:RNA polymerase sigma-70 factor (ECF subfamily)
MSSTRELAFEQARSKWPGVALDFEAWSAHLDTLGWPAEPPLTAASLFLCCACARHDAEACRSLDEMYLSPLRGVAARENADEEFIDWVLQSVRQQLLGGNSPQIASYDGRRPLADWLRLFVRRIALAQKLADRASLATPPVPAAELRRIKVAQ